MIALSIIAAGIIAVAVALFLRPSFELRTADQRGITLQTLIVTAVLVLMAGAAGVVIIAITNNAQDNLEGQNTGVNSRCEPWEIFDPTLSAAGRGNGEGGVDSTAIGCIRVCFVSFTTGASPTAYTDESDLDDNGATTAGTKVDLTSSNLIFSRSDRFTAPVATETAIFPVNGERSVDTNGNAVNEITANIKSIEGTEASGSNLDNFEIRVANNQRYCEVWNNTTDQQEFRSEN